MFETSKKGTDKEENPAVHKEQTTSAASFAEPPKRVATNRSDIAIIGPSIRIDGDLRGEEDLRIEGEVKGTVQLKSNSLVIGSEGRVRATVYAQSVEVEGLVEGDLYALETVHIRKSARVQGNITSPRVSLEDGAKFKGSIEMDSQAVESAMGKSRGNTNVSNLANSQKAASGTPSAQGQAAKPAS